MTTLPVGTAPEPVSLPHFPDRLHAYVWRNWQLVPLGRLARVVEATEDDLLHVGRAMGLAGPPSIREDQQRRSTITVIRRNWHLLPYEQLLDLLGWTPEQLDYALREDDFLYTKLGRLKPRCDRLLYRPPDGPTRQREEAIARVVREAFGGNVGQIGEPLFSFVAQLSAPVAAPIAAERTAFSPRYCSSYFALYGDPLLDDGDGPYPDGYLARLAASGVDGVWLQGVLYKLAPFPWDLALSARYEGRLGALRQLVARARRHGIGIYLYLNEPRSMPLAFFERHPGLRGVTSGESATLCTSAPEVQAYLRNAVASVCRAVPDLAGVFTITASENLTNCWSHHRGEGCPRCGQRSPAAVIAEVNTLIHSGIRDAGSQTRLFVWDWGWRDDAALAIIDALPRDAALISVSEWSLPISRGGVETTVGEYSLSAIGPGPRATRHWARARERGMQTIAKIQAASTWELSATPYIPVVENTARHVANLRGRVDGLMLGWTLGGYPSPNLEVVAALGRADDVPVDQAMAAVAQRRFGAAAAPVVVEAWRTFSRAFSEFPYHGGVVYRAPLQCGPANLLWEAPTGYAATMVGFPYDDLNGWRAVYPPEVFARQLELVADGFDGGVALLRRATDDASPAHQPAVQAERRVAEACALHLRSVANQARFVQARAALAAAQTTDVARPLLATLERLLEAETDLVRRLYALQMADARLGFESSNQYYYVPLDLAEKVLNCRDLLERWMPAQRARQVS